MPIVAAGGEMILHPDQVRAVGKGSWSAGQTVLHFVEKVRQQHIQTLRDLPPPKS